MCVCVCLLWSEAHAETGQVSVGEREESHEDDVPGVVAKQHWEIVTRLNVAQHEERDEDDSEDHQDGQPQTVFTWLQTKEEEKTSGFILE